jgi:hypothetical protein
MTLIGANSEMRGCSINQVILTANLLDIYEEDEHCYWIRNKTNTRTAIFSDYGDENNLSCVDCTANLGNLFNRFDIGNEILQIYKANVFTPIGVGENE